MGKEAMGTDGESGAPVHPTVRLLRERFPHLRERATELYESDDIFRDLCGDYAECAETVARIASGAASSEAMRKEYAALFLRLETEVLRYLGEHPDCPES